jgi:hypothetical protein
VNYPSRAASRNAGTRIEGRRPRAPGAPIAAGRSALSLARSRHRAESAPNLVRSGAFCGGLLLPSKNPGDPQQIQQGKSARMGARQAGLPVIRAQDRALATPDQADQYLRHDRTTERSQTLAVLQDGGFGEDVVPERRAIQEPRILEHPDLVGARRGDPDPVCSEHGYVAYPGELLPERSGDRLPRRQAQHIAAQEVPDGEARAVFPPGSSSKIRQGEERFDQLRVDAAGSGSGCLHMDEIWPLDDPLPRQVSNSLSCPLRAVKAKSCVRGSSVGSSG